MSVYKKQSHITKQEKGSAQQKYIKNSENQEEKLKWAKDKQAQSGTHEHE